ncbi:hypothetical protein ACPXCS_06255 [Streptomyces sp. DT190]|uniref:hypothetical protein n=1 Tax=unclassified Streptomyces TaxID=2593676 RepID=UPI003CF25FAB
MTRIVYEPDFWPHVCVTGQREELCEWLRANGIAPEDVSIGEEITIEPLTFGGDQVIRYTAHLRNADGHKYLDEATGEAAQEERVVPLVADPPPHWHIKETDR